MEDKKYFGDRLVEQLKKSTEINGIEWMHLPSNDLELLQKEILESIESGFVGEFRELTNSEMINWKIYLLLTRNKNLSKRYILVIKDMIEDKVTVIPPIFFKDNEYLSNLVALYQTILYNINQNILELLEEQSKKIDEFIDGWNEMKKNIKL